MPLDCPLTFRPVYQALVWGGRRLEQYRTDLPPGPVGEAWDIADHARGQSVVEAGPAADVGRTLHDLVGRHGSALVGDGFAGGAFPLLVKLIDATDRLSVQVHPDDELAQALGVGDRGKTECWLALHHGGELWQGTRPGVDRAAFQDALATGEVERTLNRFEVRRGDFFFLEPRTVHALGAGCLMYELQQTCDVTFRVDDWGRAGLDGKPRPLHVDQAMRTIEFSRSGFGPRRPAYTACGAGQVRALVSCTHFRLEEYLSPGGAVALATNAACALVTCLEGQGVVRTPGGSATLEPLRTVLVPAAARGYQVEGQGTLRFLVAQPRFR